MDVVTNLADWFMRKRREENVSVDINNEEYVFIYRNDEI